MKSVGCVLLLGMAILMSGACSGQNAKIAAEQIESVAEVPAVSGEVRSIVGTWRMEVNNQRGTWIFSADGTGTFRDPGAQERKGRYTYTAKELVISADVGSTRYTITENKEPVLKLLYRWGNSYDINITLTRTSE